MGSLINRKARKLAAKAQRQLREKGLIKVEKLVHVVIPQGRFGLVRSSEQQKIMDALRRKHEIEGRHIKGDLSHGIIGLYEEKLVKVDYRKLDRQARNRRNRLRDSERQQGDG